MTTKELYDKYLITSMVPGFEPIEAERASGTTVFARDGREYLDCFSGIAVTNAGHGHAKVIAAALSSGRSSQEARDHLARLYRQTSSTEIERFAAAGAPRIAVRAVQLRPPNLDVRAHLGRFLSKDLTLVYVWSQQSRPLRYPAVPHCLLRDRKPARRLRCFHRGSERQRDPVLRVFQGGLPAINLQ